MDKFLRTWGERDKQRTQYAITSSADYQPNPNQTSSSFDDQNKLDVALSLSKRLIGAVKVKNVLNIEAGLEMIALAMAISSEVSF